MKYIIVLILFPLILFSQTNSIKLIDSIVKQDNGYKVYYIDKSNNPNFVIVDELILNNINSNIQTQIANSHQTSSSSNQNNQAQVTLLLKKIHFAHYTYAIGLSLASVFEINNPISMNKQSFSFGGSLDLGHTYQKPNNIFSVSNELHYILNMQKPSIGLTNHFQRAQDDINTLHDISIALTKKRKWNLNLIAKTNTSLFTIFDGDYFSDYNSLGKIQRPLSPFTLNLAPGIKYNVSEALRISLSPYSFELYGVMADEVRNKGIYITDLDASGNFKKTIMRKQGFEMNIWFDKQIKEWLSFQYRLSATSEYKGGFNSNFILDGLFITKLKLIKNLYFTHRASLSSNWTNNFMHPYIIQNFLLSYSQSFQ